MNLIFATQNINKAQEIQSQLSNTIQIKSLLDLNYIEELEEDQDTLEGNALQKVRFVREKFGEDCFADDTGLEVRALNGAPGVYSARYAGEEKSFEENMNKLLIELKGIEDRSAQFRTVIACIIDDREYLFEGICRGIIIAERRGNQGFGYDPIFVPHNYNNTFAEMPLSKKTEIGHRGKAVKKLIKFLEAQ